MQVKVFEFWFHRSDLIDEGTFDCHNQGILIHIGWLVFELENLSFQPYKGTVRILKKMLSPYTALFT